MKIIVTGAAGFIGCNLVRALNQCGLDDILIVDDLTQGDKFLNLRGLSYTDYLDKEDFYPAISGELLRGVDVVFHQGACSDTTVRDGRYMMMENFARSRDLLRACRRWGTRLIYASSAAVYGASSVFREEPAFERPLNVYGYSKLLFDQVVRRTLDKEPDGTQIAGLRYFNVYGPHEQHKGRMASVAFHHFGQLHDHGRVRLFGEYGGYAAGAQQRDFVFVGDVVAQNMMLLNQPLLCGVFNAGTGRAEPFNEVAHQVVNSVRAHKGQPALSLSEQVSQQLIEYVPFPDDLRGRYQCHTQADMRRWSLALKALDQSYQSASVAEGISLYAKWLLGGEGAEL